MTTPVAAVAHSLAYELILEVDTSATSTPTWTKVRFLSGFDPTITPTTKDATTYDDEGTQRDVRVGETWAAAFALNLYRDVDGAYMPEAEVFRKAADPGVRGEAAEVHVRWYDAKGADLAYEGRAGVTWKRATTGSTDLGTATVTLTGKGPLEPIATPVLP